MKAIRVRSGSVTDIYEVIADEGETLTAESINEYMHREGYAIFGTAVEYNNGVRAEVRAYVD